MSLPFWRTLGRPRAGKPARPPRRPRLEGLEGRWLPSTFLVTTGDDAGPGSLRQAILDANATPGASEIDFAVGDGGAQTIRPRSDLPWVTHSVVIDGSTQPGFAGSPLIDLDGGAAAYVNGLTIAASGCTVRGLALTNFAIPDDPETFLRALTVYGSGNVVEGNYIGIDRTGTRPAGNSIGVQLVGSDNRVGGTADAQRNLISGNGFGVWISFASGNVIEGNYIGTDVTGTAAVGNGSGVYGLGTNTLVGGTTAEARNVISGNGAGISFGVYESSTGVDVPNVVQGNYIGTDVTGTRALGNASGVILEAGTLPGHLTLGGSLLIGGTEPGAGNLISGNRGHGVQITWGDASDVIQGNRIGTDVTGTQALANLDGVYLTATSGALIGGAEAGAGNLISGNRRDGIYLYNYTPADAAGSIVQGNLIGTDVSGTQALGNVSDGVHIDGSNGERDNTVGGNVIAYNGNDGVLVDRSTGNAILGNAIFANGNLGIELVRGGDHDQAAPVLTAATTDGTTTTVTGTLDSTPDTTFTLEVYANAPGDPPGSGEVFLGTVVVTTDAAGHADFTATFAPVDPGWFLTATATDAANNTSPFSAGAEVSG
jgi:titin